MVIRRIKPIHGIWITLLVFIVFFKGIGTGFAAPLVEFSNDTLTVRAENYPLVRLLEQVAKKTNVVVFVSKDFNPGPVSIQFNKIPLEKAFKKLLKQHDFVTIYNKRENDFIISALKIYPKGKNTGKMDVLISKSVSTEKTHGENAGFSPTIPGLTLPGEYVRYAARKDKSLIQIAHGFEKKEKKASKEINELRQNIGQTDNKAEKDLLTLELMDRLMTFETLQREHGDSLESLYRASLFKQTAKSDD